MRFLKEYIILIVVVLFVVLFEIITTNITNTSLKEIDGQIEELEAILEEDENLDRIEEFMELWKNKEGKIEFYMAHKELEEISLAIVDIKACIKNDKIDDAKEELDEVKFRVEHIKNMQKIELKNIF